MSTFFRSPTGGISAFLDTTIPVVLDYTLDEDGGIDDMILSMAGKRMPQTFMDQLPDGVVTMLEAECLEHAKHLAEDAQLSARAAGAHA